MATATFAAGCFWHVEEAFRHVKGVLGTRVGYTGGKTKDPTYKEVCTGETDHAEAVEIQFDPKKVSYEKLLEIFWKEHNPTTINRQGLDEGTQYRSAIFFHTPQQQKAAKASKAKLQKSGKFEEPIVTEIVKAGPFYPAEKYHQRYFEKHGLTVCPGQ